MSPILVRPVREQLEHDRVIRLLQAKYKRKFEVAINPGTEQSAAVGNPESPWYPDLVLHSADKTRKLAGVVEVESAESVNHLEAMSQWKAFSALRVPFHLYLPISSIDTARRFCTDMEIPVAEMWTYQAVGDQIRFALIHRTAQGDEGKAAGSAESEPASEPRPRVAVKAGAARSGAAKAAAPRPAAPKAASAKPAASRTAASRGGGAARGTTPARPATPARVRGNGAAARPAAARRAAAGTSRPAPKPKAAAARRPAAKPAAAARKAKPASTSRAHKRR